MDLSQSFDVGKDVFESSFTWTFGHFKTMIDKELLDEELKTPKISISGVPFKWQLAMKMVEINESDRQLGHINFTSSSPFFKLTFFEDKPATTKYKRIDCHFKIGPYPYGEGSVTLFPRKGDIIHNIQSGELVVTNVGALEIKCHLKAVGYFFDNGHGVFNNSRSNDEKLVKDVSAMLHSENTADLTLVVMNHELKVHKSILAARSPCFKQMFETHKNSARIMISDVSVEAVQLFVKFLYTATVTPTEHSKDLLSLAALHQLEDLKQACEKMLVTQLNRDNALDSLYLANLHNFSELKKTSFQMIAHGALSSLRTIPEHLMNSPKEVDKMMSALKKWNEAAQNGHG